MSSSSIRFGLPKELADEIDALVGQRKRSLFVCDAVREKLHQNDRMQSIRHWLAEPPHSLRPGSVRKAQKRTR